MSAIYPKLITMFVGLAAIVWLYTGVAHAAGVSIALTAPANITVGSNVPLYVYVTNNGIPQAGVAVNVSASGAGTMAMSPVTTNSTGYATASIHASTTVGTVNVIASYGGVQASALIPVLSGPPVVLQMTTSPLLLPSDGYSTSSMTATAVDLYGNACNGWPMNLTIDGTLSVVNADSSGSISRTFGPRTDSHTYAVSVNANGITRSASVRFFLVNIYMLTYPSTVQAGTSASVTAWLMDDLTPAPGILLNFTVYSPNSLATPSSFAGYTDATGKLTFNFTTSSKAGVNTIIASNQTLGGDLSYAMIRGTSGTVKSIVLSSSPASPVLADGNASYKLMIWAKDSGGNPVKSEDLTITRNLATNYTVTTNNNGYAELDLGPSIYVENVRLDVMAGSGVSGNITLAYVAGPPAKAYVKAVPNVIASSDIATPGNMTDVHATDVIGRVTDLWDHPLPGQNITIKSLNNTAGNITGPSSGNTDENGEIYTTFLLGNSSFGTGIVNISATSGSFSSTFPIIYTNTTFLSVDTSITPRNVTVNDTIDVSVTLKGLGWKNRPQPVDIMLVTDRSGSMDWYSTVVYPTTGVAKQGTLAVKDKEYLIDTYNNVNYNALQFMLSSPYTNYANNSYYYGLKITDPSGKNWTGTQSSNENYYQFPTASKGVYKIYAKFSYAAAGGTPLYSMSVLTKPLRLGSSMDIDSAAKVAAIQMINNMSPLDQVGLSSFYTSATLDASLKLMAGSNKTNLINAVNNLDANGGTNVYTGMQKARQEIEKNGRGQYKHVMIVLTDGYSQSPASDITEAYNAQKDGITVYTIGMGMPDEVTLGKIANITGGHYYRVASDLELAQSYRDILTNITDVVANNSFMDVISRRSIVNGTTMSDAEYVPGSALVTLPNTNVFQIEPNVTYNNTQYQLNWDPGQIRMNEVWNVDYKLKIMHGGLLTPITGESFVGYNKSDGTSGSTSIVADTIYCRDSAGGTIVKPTPSLSVNITSPVSGFKADQLRIIVSWNVQYTGDGIYTQTLSTLSENDTQWMDIAKGFSGAKNSSGTYQYTWNIERIPTGNYTLRLYTSDGTYDAEDSVTISIPYISGKIVLQ